MSRYSRILAGIAILAALAVFTASCSKPQSETPTGTTPAPKQDASYKITMVIYGSPGNPFWTKVRAGAEEAGEKFGCSVDIQYANDDAAKQNDILGTAIANNVDGIALAINYDNAYTEVVKRAREKGIGVIAFNIDDTKKAAGNARMAYIGQDMEQAGFQIANRLIKEAGLKKGGKVVCPVENPQAVYAVQRYAGAKRAFSQAGIRSEVLNTGGVSLEETLNRLTQYLLGNKDTSAILAMGGMPMEEAPQAVMDAGLNIPNAGFDLTKQIAQNIKDGKSLATIDQQPFYQGFLTISQLYYFKKYGLSPCDINTGGAMVDKSNVEKVLALADSIR